MDSVINEVTRWYTELNQNLTWSTVTTYGSILAGTWFIYSWFIKPFLSPLRKIPGMPYNPLWGSMYIYMKGEAIQSSVDFITKFGPIMRYYFFGGGERLLVADPDYFKHITTTNSKNYIKPPGRMKMIALILGKTGLVTINGKEHLARRKIINPTFNYASVRKMLPLFEVKTSLLIDKWGKRVDDSGQPTADMDVQENLTHLTLDVIGEAAFGHKFDSLREKSSEVTDAFTKMLTGFDLSLMFIAIPFYNKLPVPEVNRMKHLMSIIEKTVYDVIQTKRDLLDNAGSSVKEEVEKDLLGMLMSASYSDGAKLSQSELRDQVVTFLFAGHETTSISIGWALLVLAQHQSVQDKLRAEIKQQLPPAGQTIDWQTLENMQYLDCVVKESLRLYPAVPLVIRQSVEDDHIGGYFIPGGTIVLMSTGAMMRRPDLWPDPEKFDPDRFLDKDISPYKWMPFVQGPRMCIGYKFALLEMKLVLAMLVRELKFDVIPGFKVKRKQRITMRPDPNLQLRISRVKE